MFGILIDILILIYIAKYSSRGVKFLLYSLSGFWTLGFLIRPLLFLYARDYDINNSVYDSRIGQNPSNFTAVMFPIVLGCFIFTAVLGFSFFMRKRKIQSNHYSTQNLEKNYSQILLLSLFIGILALVLENSFLRNPFSKSLTPLISISLIVYFWNRQFQKLTKQTEIIFLFIGLLSLVILASNAFNSKGVLLTPLYIFVFTLPIWKRKRSYLKKIALICLLVFSTFPLFTLLQRVKLGDLAQVEANRNSEFFPFLLSPFLELTQRFDGFARVTDAVFAEPTSLGGVGSWFKTALSQFFWNPSSGRTAISFGGQWNDLVTNQSIPSSYLSSVSLSANMIAEGLIWRGFSSLIVECILIALLFNWLGQLLEKGLLSSFFAFGIISNMTLFEIGLVSICSSFNATLKFMLFIWVLTLLFNKNKFNSDNNRQRKGTSRKDSQ